MRDKIKDVLLDSIQIKEELLRTRIGDILKISRAMIECLKKKGKILVCGNGGSAGDSQHIVAELVGKFQKERPGLSAVALTTNTSILTAIGNDYGYEQVFSRQVEALAQKNDLLLGISTSGKAKNVACALRQAKKAGIKTAILTGGDGGELAKLADICLIVPSSITARIQEAHITIGHIICGLIEEAFS